MSAAPPILPKPSQGEIWAVRLPTEPADKAARYVIVVSPDAQNHHSRATTVLVVPLSTTLCNSPCLRLSPEETGLGKTSEKWANDISCAPNPQKVSKLNHGARSNPLNSGGGGCQNS